MVLKLIIDSYLDMILASFMSFYGFHAHFSDFFGFFSTLPNFISSILSMLFFPVLLVFPFFVRHKLIDIKKKLLFQEKNTRRMYSILYNEIKTERRI